MCTDTNIVEVKIFTVAIVDSGVLMAVQPCGTFDDAEKYIADYFNAPDEMAKHGVTLKRLPGCMTNDWIDRQPTLSVTITESVLRIY